jgi:hypothetical protein
MTRRDTDATWGGPLAVTDRPFHADLSPGAERQFLLKQAEYEAAYRRIGDPLVLFDALTHVWWSRQTVPRWLVPLIGNALIKTRTDAEAERYRERMRHVRRYVLVRDLRRKYTKRVAIERAVVMLKGENAAAGYETIEKSCDLVRRDLERLGRESEYFFLVDDSDPNKGG